MPAISHQTATDKGDIAGSKECHQLTHGVAKKYIHLLHRLIVAASCQTIACVETEIGHRIKALGMAWHQYQQGIVDTLFDLVKGLKNDFVFAAVSAGGKQDGPLIDAAPLLP